MVLNVEISEPHFLPSIKSGVLTDEIVQFLTNHLIRSTAIREQRNNNHGTLAARSLSHLEIELLIYYHKEGKFLEEELKEISDRVAAEKKQQDNSRKLHIFQPVNVPNIPQPSKRRTIDVLKVRDDKKKDALHTTAELLPVRVQEIGVSVVWEFTLEEFELVEDIFSVLNQDLRSEVIGEKIRVLSTLLNVSELATESDTAKNGKRDTLTTKRLFENHSVTMLKRDLLDLLRKKYHLPADFKVSTIMPFNIFISCKGHPEKNITLRDEVTKLLQHWLNAVLAERSASNAVTKPIPELKDLATDQSGNQVEANN